MNKKDYLDKITSKIFNRQDKIKIIMEVESHIDENIDKYKDIGYDEETSKEKALLLMGSDETVAEQLGAIHNQRQSPALAIILFVLWVAFLGGAYFLLDKFAFGDVGASSLIIGSFIISLALCLISCAVAFKKNTLPFLLATTIGSGVSGIFSYLILNQLNQNMRGSLQNLIDFSLNHDLYVKEPYTNDKSVILCVSIAFAFVVLLLLFGFVYYIKVHNLNNSRLDNKIRNKTKQVCIFAGVILVCVGVLFCTKTIYDINQIYAYHKQTIETAIDISENCKNIDQLKDYIADSKLNFFEDTDSKGKLKGYHYSKGVSAIEITIDENNNDAYTDTLGQSGENVLAEDAKNIYTIMTYMSSVKFENGHDSLTLSKLKTNQELITSFNPIGVSYDEEYDYYRNITPSKFYYELTNSKYYDNQYKFTYVIDAIVPYEEYCEVKTCTNKISYHETRDKIVDIVKNNKDATPQQFAKLTNTTYRQLYDSFEEFKQKVYGVLADKYNESYMRDAYDSAWYYFIDDSVFFAVDKELFSIIVFYENGNIIESVSINDYEMIGNSNWVFDKIIEDNYDVAKDKCSFGGYYYDKYGYCYTKYENVKYYTESGDEFVFYPQKITDDDKTTRDYYKCYFTNGDVYYDYNKCFVDENGCFVYDSSGKITFSGDTLAYVDSYGNYYHHASCTSWDADGNKYARKYTNKDIELWQ